jgi:hypothetical protein
MSAQERNRRGLRRSAREGRVSAGYAFIAIT